MTQVTQTISIDLELSIDLHATMVKDHYGVPGSPVWQTDTDHEFGSTHVEIMGVKVALSSLPKELQDALLEECIARADFDKWEAGE